MAKNKIAVLIIVAVALLGASILVIFNQSPSSVKLLDDEEVTVTTTPQPTVTEEPVNYYAGFAIFTNGIKRNFSAAMYHNLSKDVFINASNPDIVSVKKRGVTWDDFFKTLPFGLTHYCLTTGSGELFCTSERGTLKFYLDGIKAEDLLSREIQDGNRVLISYGSENEAEIQKQIKRVQDPKGLIE